MKNSNRGFTLIELLVVIAIIGILSSVVLASLNSARQKSRDAKRISDIKQLQLALELYFDANGTYPPTLAPLSAGGFISQVPTDPVGTGTTAANYSYVPLATSSATAVCPTATPCMFYALGAGLEQAGHAAHGGDADKVVGTGGAVFNGADTGICTTGKTAGRYCFDVTP